MGTEESPQAGGKTPATSRLIASEHCDYGASFL